VCVVVSSPEVLPSPDALLDRWAALVEPLLLDDPGTDLGTDPGPEAEPHTGLRLTVARQELCSPEIANRSFVAAELEQIWQQFRVEAHLLVRVEVDKEGRVAGAELIEPSGHAAIDAAVSRLLLRIQFHPARDDRIPVATFNPFPLSIRAGR